MSSSQRSRRPSVSIYDYPEHLNPFNDDTTNSQSQVHHEGKSSKESKHKFWTFGRSRKKRSNSFSIKSWSGLFGKRKEPSEPVEKRSTITTVSTTYKREPYDKPIVPPRLSKDQQEFDEALGTLTRRRKYTLDNNSSRYSSNMTVNGDPAKIYDGNPQDTTTSIMGVDLTPKPPVRRFGQVSPRPTDKIPPLNFEEKHPQNGGLHDKSERTPVPPMRRFGNRSSQRLNGTTSDFEEDLTNRSGNVSLKDENENVPEDYVFKRFSQDAVRKSNLSINSCVSVTSTASTYGRKKRRAPQPPKRKEPLETPLETDSRPETNKTELTPEASKIELQIIEPIDITKATENIDEMIKKSCEELNEKSTQKEEKQDELLLKTTEDTLSDDIAKSTAKGTTKNETCEVLEDCVPEVNEKKDSSEERSACNSDETLEEVELEMKVEEKTNTVTEDPIEKDPVNIEYNRTSQEKIEIIKDVDPESDEVCLRKKDSSGTLTRSDSFSVKEEIEKIEKQIKALESRNKASKEQENIDNDTCHDQDHDQVTNTRLSIQTNRRHFFENMVDSPSGPIKLEFKKLPCEQKDIHIVRLTDPPIPVAAPRDAVKVIELHISEPIRHKPELLDEVNPIPKPRRHSALSLKDMPESRLSKNENKSLENNGKRGSF